MSQCDTCRAFRPAFTLLYKNDYCQFIQKLYTNNCSLYCTTYEQWHKIWVNRHKDT